MAPSENSSPGSSRSSGGTPFVSDPGPGFDERAAAAGAEQVREDADAEARALEAHLFEVPLVEEEKVRTALFNGGDAIHAVVGVGDYDWVCTQRDLDRIAPPLTRIINRYELARAVAGRSDEFALATGVGLYAWRSILERQAVLAGREAPAPPENRGQPPPPPPPPEAPARAPAPGSTPPEAPAPAPQQFRGPIVDENAGGRPVPVEVVPGYVTRAERIRQARERTPYAVPAEAPPTP